jgi:hypothetical protein
MLTRFATALVAVCALIGPSHAVAQRALFHGTMHDCDGVNFGGHLPKGFICRGTGTGVGICAKPEVGYDVQGGPAGYCHLDWVTADELQLNQYRAYSGGHCFAVANGCEICQPADPVKEGCGAGHTQADVCEWRRIETLLHGSAFLAKVSGETEEPGCSR